MQIFAWLSLLGTLIIMLIGQTVMIRDPKNRLNRLFFLFCVLGAFNAFAEYGYRSAETAALAEIWLRASSFWVFLLPVLAHFIAEFDKDGGFVKMDHLVGFGYFPALIFSVYTLFDPAVNVPVRVDWGWTYIYPETTFINGLYEIWVVCFAAFTLYLSGRIFFRAEPGLKKEQAKHIFFGSLAFSLVGLFEFIYPLYGERLPELTTFAIIFQCLMILTAMFRYQLFELDPFSAAETILGTISDAIILVDEKNRITSTNYSAGDLLDCPPHELLESKIDMLPPEEDRRTFRDIILTQVAAGKTLYESETKFLTSSGEPVPVSISASPHFNNLGQYQGAVFVARNLTRRKRDEKIIRDALQEKEVLLMEVHHRVKNNMQLISGLLNLQITPQRGEDVNQILIDNRNRIFSMAQIHELLYRTDNLAKVSLPEYTEQLVVQVVSSLLPDPDRVSLELDIEDIHLSMNQTVYYGLVINELVTNAVKYAFPDGISGQISLRLQKAGRDRCRLEVKDDGIGLPKDLEHDKLDTLGLSLVSMLVEQMEGNYEYETKSGTLFIIEFPLS